MYQAVCSQPLPCDAAAGSRVFQSNVHDVSGKLGCRQPKPTDSGVFSTTWPSPLFGLRWGHTAGTSAYRGVRWPTSNRSKRCCANSTIRFIVWRCSDTHEQQVMLGHLVFIGCRHVLDGHLAFLWDNPTWQAAMSGWAMHHAQHDVGEFLRYLARQSSGLKLALESSWEARPTYGMDVHSVFRWWMAVSRNFMAPLSQMSAWRFRFILQLSSERCAAS